MKSGGNRPEIAQIPDRRLIFSRKSPLDSSNLAENRQIPVSGPFVTALNRPVICFCEEPKASRIATDVVPNPTTKAKTQPRSFRHSGWRSAGEVRVLFLVFCAIWVEFRHFSANWSAFLEFFQRSFAIIDRKGHPSPKNDQTPDVVFETSMRASGCGRPTGDVTDGLAWQVSA